MEQDRYKINHFMFIFCMISLLFTLCLLFFSIFVFPNLILGMVYDVPTFIAYWREWLASTFNWTDNAASKIIFLMFFIPVFIFGYIAYLLSNYIEDQVFQSEEGIKKNRQAIGEKKNFLLQPRGKIRDYFLLKIILVLLIEFLVVIYISWLITASSI